MKRRRFLGLAACAALAPRGARAEEAAFLSGRVAMTRRGAGPDVILIPGLASTPAVWDRLVLRLEGRYRLHLAAVRGFGDLPAADNATGALSAPVAAEIVRYIRSAGLVGPALIGHSLGGQMALRAAAHPGAGVGRVMAVDASPFFPELLRPGATVAEIEPTARLIYQAVQLLGDEALRNGGRALGVDAAPAAEAVFGAMGWQGGDRRVLAQGLYEAMTADLRGRLALVSAPVTVTYGLGVGRDSPRRQMEARLRAAYARLPHPPRYEPIADAEHMVMIDRPLAFAAAVERFLAA